MSAGVLGQISFKQESTWGTPVVPDKSLAVHFTGGIKTDQDVQLLSSLKSQLPKNYDAFVGKRTHEGEYEFDLFPDYSGWFLKGMFGSVNSALKGGESVVYEHSFSEQESKPSFTIEQALGEIVRRYAGSLAHSLKITAKAGEAVVMTVGVKAKSSASATKNTPAYPTLRPFNFKDAGVQIGGTTLGQVENLELEYKNNIDLLHTLNSTNDPSFSYTGASEVSGKAELYLDATTAAEYANYLNKTERSLDLVLTGDAIGTSSNHKLELSIPRNVLKTAEVAISEEYHLLSIEFEGLYDTATSKLLSAKLTNLITNYT